MYRTKTSARPPSGSRSRVFGRIEEAVGLLQFLIQRHQGINIVNPISLLNGDPVIAGRQCEVALRDGLEAVLRQHLQLSQQEQTVGSYEHLYPL